MPRPLPQEGKGPAIHCLRMSGTIPGFYGIPVSPSLTLPHTLTFYLSSSFCSIPIIQQKPGIVSRVCKQCIPGPLPSRGWALGTRLLTTLRASVCENCHILCTCKSVFVHTAIVQGLCICTQRDNQEQKEENRV